MKTRFSRWDQMKKISIPLQSLVDEYLSVCRTKGKTLSTMRSYQEKLRRVLRFFAGATLEDFTLQTVRAYIDELQHAKKYDSHPVHATQEQGLSGTTLKGHAVVIKGFATWLYEEEYTTTNVLGRLKPPKAPKKVMDPDGGGDYTASVLLRPKHSIWQQGYCHLAALFGHGAPLRGIVGARIQEPVPKRPLPQRLRQRTKGTGCAIRRENLPGPDAVSESTP